LWEALGGVIVTANLSVSETAKVELESARLASPHRLPPRVHLAHGVAAHIEIESNA
jgi:hypothetical protein